MRKILLVFVIFAMSAVVQSGSLVDALRSMYPRKAPPALTAEQIADFTDAFAQQDVDGDGKISIGDLRSYMQASGKQVSDGELQAMIDEADTDHNGTIELPEYIAVMAKRLIADVDEENDLAVAFKALDKDGNGFITAAELKQALAQRGVKFTEQDIDQMIQEYDIDDDGQINYDEFIRIFLSN